MERSQIAKELKDISLNFVVSEWNKIRSMNVDELNEVNGRSRLGCNIIDYYFFEERLNTVGNKGTTFFDFLEEIEEYKKKKYIQTLLTFCDKNNRYINSLYKRYYYCYGLCFGRINAFKITNALSVYRKYNPTSILDPFCGFGGRLMAAIMMNVNYYGIDINVNLKSGYESFFKDLNSNKYLIQEQSGEKSANTVVFQDSLIVEYDKLDYDMVFTSPPYENIEVYSNSEKKTSEQWTTFYNTIFQKLWMHLKPGGVFAININDKIYKKILVPMLGDAEESIVLKKSSKNNYSENIYVWVKNEVKNEVKNDTKNK